jgi:CDGSH-type Zn-finger protein/uncharacterized Fe-S cluster protein YjdI
MAEKYSGLQDDRPYQGETGVITYNLKRCLHAAECTRGLPAVFDTKKRPWINPNGALAAELQEIIQRCPSGALHFIPNDEQLVEPIPKQNIIYLEKNGYLRFVGNLRILSASTDIRQETRAALCRCGASEQKPFCDNTHREIGFTTPEVSPTEAGEEEPGSFSGSTLLINADANGPLEIQGNFEIRDEHNTLIHRGSHTWLCRCGHSNNKPFCDSSHRRVGFSAP